MDMITVDCPQRAAVAMELGGVEVTPHVEYVTHHGRLTGRDEPDQHPAASVVFDDSRSGLGAENVQQAVDAAAEALASVTITAGASGGLVVLQDSTCRPLDGLKLQGRTSQRGTPVPDAPLPLVSACLDGKIKTRLCGKNILKTTAATQTCDGVTFTVGSDGSITAHGTAEQDGKLSIHDYLNLPAGEVVVLSGCPAGNGSEGWSITAYDSSWVGIQKDTGSGAVLTVPADGIVHIRLRYQAGAVFSGTVFRPMLCGFSAADGIFEPYSAQTLTTDVPEGLPGVPVASGGSCTDSSGRQWVCDEIDFARGVYIRRVGMAVYRGLPDERWYLQGSTDELCLFNASGVILPLENSTGNYLCTHARPNSTSSQIKNTGSYVYNGTLRLCVPAALASAPAQLNQYLESSPLTVMYPLAQPEETPLSAEAMDAFAALRTGYPLTTVFTDCGADVDVSYRADHKNYIDSRIAALTAAVLSLGGNV